MAQLPDIVTARLEDYLISLECSSDRKLWNDAKMIREELQEISNTLDDALYEIDNESHDLEEEMEVLKEQIEDLEYENDKLKEKVEDFETLKQTLKETQNVLEDETGRIIEFLRVYG
jgi:chromosome segregation ATPase